MWPYEHSCKTAYKYRSLKLYGLIGYFNVSVSNLLIFASSVFICCYNFRGGIFPVLKTNLEKHFCHKADSCTFIKCSKEQQQIIMLLAKRRKGPTLWSPEFWARFWSKYPRTAGTHFPKSLMLLVTSPVLSQNLVFPTSDSSFQHYFFDAYFLFLNWVHLCFPVCLSYYQTALLSSSRINFCIAVSLIYGPILHSWPTVLHPDLCALPVPVSFIGQTLLQSVSLPLLQLPSFWTHQQAEEWLERSSDPYSKLNLNPMLAPSKAFFLLPSWAWCNRRPPHNSAPEGRCQRLLKLSKALHSRDMSLTTRQAGIQWTVLKLNPVPLLEQFRYAFTAKSNLSRNILGYGKSAEYICPGDTGQYWQVGEVPREQATFKLQLTKKKVIFSIIAMST